MFFNLRFIVKILILIHLTGCVSTPVKVSKAKPIPLDRILNKPTVKSKTPASITVVRDAGFTGGGHSILLKVDGLEITSFDVSEKFSFDLDPGSHIFSIKSWGGPPVESETFLKENETAYYRISILSAGMGIQKSAELAD